MTTTARLTVGAALASTSNIVIGVTVICLYGFGAFNDLFSRFGHIWLFNVLFATATICVVLANVLTIRSVCHGNVTATTAIVSLVILDLSTWMFVMFCALASSFVGLWATPWIVIASIAVTVSFDKSRARSSLGVMVVQIFFVLSILWQIVLGLGSAFPH